MRSCSSFWQIKILFLLSYSHSTFSFSPTISRRTWCIWIVVLKGGDCCNGGKFKRYKDRKPYQKKSTLCFPCPAHPGIPDNLLAWSAQWPQWAENPRTCTLASKWGVTHPAISSPLHGPCQSCPASAPVGSGEPWTQNSASTNFIQPSITLHYPQDEGSPSALFHSHLGLVNATPNIPPRLCGIQGKINTFLPLEHVWWE